MPYDDKPKKKWMSPTDHFNKAEYHFGQVQEIKSTEKSRKYHYKIGFVEKAKAYCQLAIMQATNGNKILANQNYDKFEHCINKASYPNADYKLSDNYLENDTEYQTFRAKELKRQSDNRQAFQDKLRSRVKK